jgi:hypothetical protein
MATSPPPNLNNDEEAEMAINDMPVPNHPPIEMWGPERFKGRQTIGHTPTKSVVVASIPNNDVLCDLCNEDITVYPVAVIGTYAHCQKCLGRYLQGRANPKPDSESETPPSRPTAFIRSAHLHRFTVIAANAEASSRYGALSATPVVYRGKKYTFGKCIHRCRTSLPRTLADVVWGFLGATGRDVPFIAVDGLNDSGIEAVTAAELSFHADDWFQRLIDADTILMVARDGDSRPLIVFPVPNTVWWLIVPMELVVAQLAAN